MYKMIVSDLDESLLKDDGSVSARDLETIARLKRQGIKFVPNTGRGFASVQRLLDDLGTRGEAGQYVISYNGGAVVDNAHNEIVLAKPLPFEVADQIFQLAMAHPDYCAHVYTFHHVYVTRPNPVELGYLANRQVAFTEFHASDLQDFAGRDIAKVIFQHPEMKMREALRDEVAKTIDYQPTVSFSSNRYVEFNPAGIDKGDAAIALGARIGIAPDEIIALGDNSNDLSMIRKVGLGVAVANAIPAVKEAAGLVLDVTNNEDPVTALATKLRL
ncbi:Cof-type HAD-IIB family hydrolase [Lacticaseibacillus mingshuiensis]|uniref:Cof-type HAD-IIB family hydrolase n=1 Tax=Lacticaseibacillus mingshuiensis TaxID=2799574 RepID=A0ABW4CHF5_9LACO|nr:Cof-type HAD-IIB family hydrolase [Lacticaseibacillus mingshuiensis]